MKQLKILPYKHLAFWLSFWLLQSLLFSGGSYFSAYLVKNIAIVLLQAAVVYFNLYALWPLLKRGMYPVYILIAILLVYLVYAVSKELIGLSFSIFTPDIKYIIVRENGWWPTDFWRILSGSAPYSIALMASTIFGLLRSKQTEKPSGENSSKQPEDNDSDTLLLKEGKVVHRLDLNDILFIQGMKEYVSWHTEDKKVITLHSLASLEDSLASKGFLRTHKSYIVNTRCVSLVKYDAVEIPGKRIPIGRSYRERVQGRFKSEI